MNTAVATKANPTQDIGQTPGPQHKPKYIAVTDWPNHHPWPPLGGLRHLIFNADKNGFGMCLRRVGRKILIREDLFFKWVEGKNNGGAAHG